MNRDVPVSKADRYAALVAARKEYDSEAVFGLGNPAHIEGGRYDADEIGPWTRWSGDLDADLMVVGQDWGDRNYFVRRKGLDSPNNPTSLALAELLASAGRPLPPIPTADAPLHADAHRRTGAFLTNALLWLKNGGMGAKVRSEWFAGDNATFLLTQIDIVQPRVIVALGQQAHRAIMRAYGIPVLAGPFRASVEAVEGTPLPDLPGGARLFAVYHCGTRARNTIRPLVQQRRDWERIGRALAGR